MESLPFSLTLGLLVSAGLAAGALTERVGLPRITGYVCAGMLFSEHLLGGSLGGIGGEGTETITSIALGVIAYLIGGSITLEQMRSMGKLIAGTALGESLGALLVVAAAVFLLAPPVPGVAGWKLALVFGAIAATTAPAGTVAVLHQYRARGPLSRTLLGVVALDDALGVIYFSMVLVVASGHALRSTVGLAVAGIGGALVLGVLVGQVVARAHRFVGREEIRLAAILAAIFLVVGTAEAVRVSPLLAAMALGFGLRASLGDSGERFFAPIENAEELVFVLFFTIAGAHFDPTVFSSHASLIGTYFVARIVGKLVGSAIAGKLAGAPPPVVRWLGLGLVPQAGVAIGLALTLAAEPAFREIAAVFVNVILATTVLYELLGPVATRFALVRAGECGPRREVIP